MTTASDDTRVDVPSDEAFRALVDGRGILREGALASPARTSCFTVFAQRPDARVELATWQQHAARFFEARVGLVVDKSYDTHRGFPHVDAARVVIAPPNAPGATRYCFARPREGDDLAAAEDADIAAGSPGLGLLARRCPVVWLVVAEDGDDGAALLFSAILASVVLGPILAPDQRALFGVRTARAKLATLGTPYR